MAISKITLNGVTQMDVTQKTVTAASMLNGITSLKNDGTDITGNIASKSSSDLTASGPTVTAPAGYYANSASKTIPDAEVFMGSANEHYETISGRRFWKANVFAEVNAEEGDVPGWVPDGYHQDYTFARAAIQANTTVTPSTSAQTIGGADYMMEGPVTVAAMPSGTAGTPTASKGTVSNHAISVTPSVTNTTGYITGGTKTGTAVSVSASELVSGTKSITSSGTTDVTNYASASVASGSATTPATTVTANPSISVSSGGLITATASATQFVTPTVSAGYVSSGTAGTITVSGSNTSQLSTQAGATISPTESEQTAVSAGKYTTGAIKVGAISSTYVGSGITQRSSSDLTVSGVTVTAPSGYYSSDAAIDLAIENKLPDFATYSTATVRGVTFTWTNGQCAITGANTGTNPSYTNLYNSTTALPSALVAGNSYYLGLKWNRTPTAFVRVYCYNSQGSAVLNKILRNNGEVITIPDNAVGLTLRVEVGVNISGADGDILKDIILLSIT